MTEEQEIRAAAALVVYGGSRESILELGQGADFGTLVLSRTEELEAMERYIKEGLYS